MKIESAGALLFRKLFNNMKNQIQYLSLLFFILCLSLQNTDSSAQEMSEEDRETFNQGVFHFERKDYQNGLSYFRELINKFPRDPVFNYFSGVSMTELNIDLETAIRQLELASLGKIPKNVWFYLGKAHHIRTDFNAAISNYQQFKSMGERTEIRELEVDNLIGLCKNEVVPAGWKISQREFTQRSQVASQKSQTSSLSSAANPSGTTEYDRMVAEAYQLQEKADSVRNLADQKRIALRIVRNEEEKSALEKEILVLEKSAYDYQNRADAKLKQIKSIETRIAEDTTNPPAGISPGSESVGYNFQQEMELNPGMMLGKQLNDESYFESLVKDLFPGQKETSLDNLIRMNSNAVQTMKNAGKIEKDINQEELKANGAKNKRENDRIIGRIKEMKETALQLKYDAIIQYQKVNDDLYQIFDQEIKGMNMAVVGDPQRIHAENYQREASRAYNHALTIREESGSILNLEKKYDKIAEANAYELIALENQKRAYATLTGILPVPSETKGRISETEAEGGATNRYEEAATKRVVADEERQDLVVSDKNKAVEREEKEEKELLPGMNSEKIKVESFDESRYTNIEEKYGFQVTNGSPYSDTNPIPTDRILPFGVIYRIQVGVFSRMVRPDYYRTLSPVSAETDLEKNFFRYYTGYFKAYSEAEEALPLVHDQGYRDAFVVAHFQNQKISIDRARELEDLMTKENLSIADREKLHELQTPVYRIQFGIFPSPLTEMSLQFYRAKAGNYPIENLHNIKGEYVYTIGIFLTFEEAKAAREKLLSKGLEKLDIISFVGSKRVPME